MDDKIKQLYDKTRANLLRWGVSEEEADEFMKEIMETADKDDDGSIKDDVKKSEENIEEKGADEQTDKDRVDESVGEQLKDDGKEDEQSAKDRVDESEGEEKAEEEKKAPDGGPSLSDMDEVEEPAKDKEEPAKEEVPAEEPKQEAEQPVEENKTVTRDEFSALLGKIDQLITLMSKGTDQDADALENAKARYGVNPGVFQNDGEEEGEKITDVRKAKAVFRTH